MECRWGTMKVAIVVSDKKKYPIQYQKPTNRNSPKKIKKNGCTFGVVPENFYI